MQSKPLAALAALTPVPLTACATQRQPGTPGIVPRDTLGEPILTGADGRPAPRRVPAG